MDDFVVSARQQITTFLAGLQWVDIAAAVIGLLAMPWGRRFWLDVNFTLCMLMPGMLTLIFPDMHASKIEGKVDVVHTELIQSLGLLMVGIGICYWLMRKSNDVTVETSLCWSLVIMYVCFLMSTEYSLFTYKKKTSKLSEQTLYTYIITVGYWLLVTLVYALKDSDWGGYAEAHGRRNLHLRIDYSFMFMMGIMIYSLPMWFLKTMMHVSSPDSLHTYLLRANAAMVIGFAILGNRASNFLREDDKQSYLLSRLITDASGLIMFCIYLTNREKWLGDYSNREILIQFIFTLLLIANAACGCNLRSIAKNTVASIKRLPQDMRKMFKMKKY